MGGWWGPVAGKTAVLNFEENEWCRDALGYSKLWDTKVIKMAKMKGIYSRHL